MPCPFQILAEALGIKTKYLPRAVEYIKLSCIWLDDYICITVGDIKKGELESP